MSFRTVYGYNWSENGWRMCNRDECDIVRIPNLSLVDTAPLRRGAPLTILGAWMRWYDQNVEEIGSQVWGWSNTNDVANSNHLSGTGIDINAPKYPWGARVMPANKIAKVREGLRLFEGTVFWGADWSRADEMHYQMNFPEGDIRNERFAQKLRDGHLGIYGPAKPVTPPAPAPNEIDREAEAAKAWIGPREFQGERPCKDGKGRYVEFENGSIYWHPEKNIGSDGKAKAIAVPKSIFETWAGLQWEQGKLGYPIGRHRVVPGKGDYQAFEGGVITRKYGQPGYVVHGKILERWIALGDVNSPAGWPVSLEGDFWDGGRKQEFEHEDFLWHPSAVARIQKT